MKKIQNKKLKLLALMLLSSVIVVSFAVYENIINVKVLSIQTCNLALPTLHELCPEIDLCNVTDF